MFREGSLKVRFNAGEHACSNLNAKKEVIRVYSRNWPKGVKQVGSKKGGPPKGI